MIVSHMGECNTVHTSSSYEEGNPAAFWYILVYTVTGTYQNNDFHPGPGGQDSRCPSQTRMTAASSRHGRVDRGCPDHAASSLRGSLTRPAWSHAPRQLLLLRLLTARHCPDVSDDRRGGPAGRPPGQQSQSQTPAHQELFSSSKRRFPTTFRRRNQKIKPFMYVSTSCLFTSPMTLCNESVVVMFSCMG